MLPTLPVISIPINITPPSSVLSAISMLTSSVTIPQPPAALTQLFLQLIGMLPPNPFPSL